MWYVLGLALIVIAVTIMPLIREQLRRPVGSAVRQGADGDFAQLSRGLTYYHWVGPVRGPVAVVIHGLTTPSIGMEALAERLGDLGYRVLVYDLYGRGLSDAPQGMQDRRFFLRQLSDLLEDQRVGDDLTVVGYSMGGAIATAFAAENPHRVKRLILVAGACVMMRESSFSHFCRTVPVLGDWLHGVAAARRLRRAIPSSARQPEVGRVLMAQKQALKRRGYLPAVLSSRRGMLSEHQEIEHHKLAQAGIPVVAVWAEEDEVIPVEASSLLAQWNGTVRQSIVKGAQHALPYTHSRELIDAIRIALRD